MTLSTTNHAENINFLFGHNGHATTTTTAEGRIEFAFRYAVQLDGIGDLHAATIRELRSLAKRLHLAGDLLLGGEMEAEESRPEPQPSGTLTPHDVCRHMENADASITATPSGDAIRLEVNERRTLHTTDDPRRILATVFYGLAARLQHAAGLLDVL